MRRVGVDEWLIRTIQAMYTNAKSSVRINGHFSSCFDVQIGIHQGSVLRSLLFIIVMEALSHHFRTGCSWEPLYADDLVIIAETLSELLEKFRTWKANLECKGLRVNVGKTKILVSALNATKPVDSSKFSSGVCNKGVGNNSIKRNFCGFWVHKRCTNIKGGCFDATTARIRSTWNKFRDLLPILTCHGLSLMVRGYAYNSCVHSVLLYASETWAATQEDVSQLNRNDMMMIRWICSAKLRDKYHRRN